jgi:uncharacterized protein YndB with AHSA1/START domain
MIRVHLERTIHRPIQQVFQHLTDIPRYPEWMPGNSILRHCTQDSDGVVGPGTTYTDRTTLGTVQGEVAEFQRPTRVVFHYSARLLGRVVLEGWPGYTLERTGPDTTLVRHDAEARLYGPFRVLQPVVQRIARNERRRTVDALKRSLESTTA